MLNFCLYQIFQNLTVNADFYEKAEWDLYFIAFKNRILVFCHGLIYNRGIIYIKNGFLHNLTQVPSWH